MTPKGSFSPFDLLSSCGDHSSLPSRMVLVPSRYPTTPPALLAIRSANLHRAVMCDVLIWVRELHVRVGERTIHEHNR